MEPWEAFQLMDGTPPRDGEDLDLGEESGTVGMWEVVSEGDECGEGRRVKELGAVWDRTVGRDVGRLVLDLVSVEVDLEEGEVAEVWERHRAPAMEDG